MIGIWILMHVYWCLDIEIKKRLIIFVIISTQIHRYDDVSAAKELDTRTEECQEARDEPGELKCQKLDTADDALVEYLFFHVVYLS